MLQDLLQFRAYACKPVVINQVRRCHRLRPFKFVKMLKENAKKNEIKDEVIPVEEGGVEPCARNRKIEVQNE